MNEKNLRQEVDKLVLKYMENKKEVTQEKKSHSMQHMAPRLDLRTMRDRNVDQPGQYLPLLAKEKVQNKFFEMQ